MAEFSARVAALEEVFIVLIAEIKHKNFLRDIHVIITARLISNGTTLSAPRFH